MRRLFEPEGRVSWVAYLTFGMQTPLHGRDHRALLLSLEFVDVRHSGRSAALQSDMGRNEVHVVFLNSRRSFPSRAVSFLRSQAT